ncbi:phage major capsid protein [uncultured Rubinisphaera sp.]|uniref:phage major capsid protein n=1 Tax=uncultured Rubinisphaera sp. TaxID=1678686 RepID=UPI0030DA978B
MRSSILTCPKYGPRVQKLTTEKESLRNSSMAAIKLSENERRDLSKAEAKEVDDATSRMEAISAEIARLEKLRAFDDEVDHSGDNEGISQGGSNYGREFSLNRGREMKDSAGNVTARIFAKGEKYVKDSPLSDDAIGVYAKCIYDGDFEQMRQYGDEYASMITTSNIDGGLLVPDALSANLVDLARANAILFQSGAQFMELQSSGVRVATITGDPTFSTTGEDSAIPPSGVQFGQKMMTLVKRAALVRVSRELMEDAANIQRILADSLTRAYAVDVDNFIINGTDNPFYNGLLDTDSINETGAIGDIAWEDLSSEVTAMRANNEMPGAYVTHPTIAGDLDELTTGDGTTSAKGWLGAPPSLEGIERKVTTNMPATKMLVGDFSYLAIGMKPSGFRLEVSSDAEFTKDMVLIKLAYRVDYAVLRSTAFRRLAGITT